ncbi:hypothetical protein DFR31_0563 [Alkalispirillum mobile]|uniref:Uncharacterized protein n=1 Tax=Alkalispirillum mobile TaxID=85925 RepID=A0A498C6H0_9GAMM|nr:hypothetical protein [Alkalispirillum mobile]RLK50657.1 hypothetical protein DFR31_0563 [Alkalispirillum mobile]
MSRELKRIRRRKATQKKLDGIWEQSNSSLIVHYSCESFYDTEDGRTPRVTSIAVRNLASGQTESFSIHKVAEQQRIPFDEIHNKYDDLEKEMLEEFFDFARTHQHFNWVHWNMRDINYGFAALEHRFRVLGGDPVVILEDRKFDLARALVSIYGLGYIEHPRLQKLIDKNRITDRGFLSGAEEAKAFEDKEYVKLHQSTLRKVDILANIFERTADGSIKTNASWLERYAAHPKILVEVIREHWVWSLIVMVAISVGLFSRVADWF